MDAGQFISRVPEVLAREQRTEDREGSCAGPTAISDRRVLVNVSLCEGRNFAIFPPPAY